MIKRWVYCSKDLSFPWRWSHSLIFLWIDRDVRTLYIGMVAQMVYILSNMVTVGDEELRYSTISIFLLYEFVVEVYLAPTYLSFMWRASRDFIRTTTNLHSHHFRLMVFVLCASLIMLLLVIVFIVCPYFWNSW